ncbi:hypothetical protein RB595_008887 [Gaeumannomyces hyphopodioides]
MVSKLFWAALLFTPAVLGAALPEIQENALDLGRRDDVEMASLPLVARAEANVAVVDEATAPEEVDDEAGVADADKKKKKKHGHKKGKKKHGHKKGKGKKKPGHKKGPHDLEARDEAEVQAPGAEVVADDVDSDADVTDADKKKKKHGPKKGKKKHGHKKGKGKKKHGHKKGPHDLEARDEAEVQAPGAEVVADDVDSDADVADADKKKKKHGPKKGKKKHGHKKGKGKKKHGHKKGPHDLEAREEAAVAEEVVADEPDNEADVADADKKKKKKKHGHKKGKGKKKHGHKKGKGKKPGHKKGPPHE